jgi:hypothetical protein
VSADMPFKLINLPVDIQSALIHYCELKDMKLPTAEVFRKTKETCGDRVIAKIENYTFTFDYLQQHFESTSKQPYKDLIKLLKSY